MSCASEPPSGGSLLAAIADQWPAFVGPTAPTREALQAIVEAHGARWRLVDPKSLRTRVGPQGGVDNYETALAKGELPTRDGSWHDAFNVLAFLSWPLAKAALHARTLLRQDERRLIQQRQRGREEDALALIDEVVLVFSGPAGLIARFEHARVAGDLEQMDAAIRAGVRVRWFGHALLEHLALDRPVVTAGVWAIALGPDEHDDEVFARQIAAGDFAAPRFSPGVPWPHAVVLAWLLA